MVSLADTRPYWVLWITAAIFAAVGLLLEFGGIQLALRGGSLYYIIIGIAVFASGVLMIRRRAEGLWLYGAVLLVTIIWSFWEVGFTPWSLVPRLAGPLALGLWLLVPWCRHALIPGKPLLPLRTVVLISVASVILGLALHNLRDEPRDPIYQTGMAMLKAMPPVARTDASADWENYGNTPGGSRFSPQSEITPQNVSKLKVAWIYRTGPDSAGNMPRIESTPIKVGRTVYFCTSYNDVIALDAETGKENWRYKSGIPMTTTMYGICRGVAYYKIPDATGECSERIYTNTIDAHLIALDAQRGTLCPGFGQNGITSLLEGMGDVKPGYYFPTSAPTIARGKIVLGGWISDGQYWGEPSGVIRAYDAVNGQLAWAFDVGRPDRTTLPPEGETYTRATPNSWAPMSVDPELGLVFAPTGNATPDYYGAQRRPFDDQYSSSVVAIELDTGHVRWSFQTLHHDLWDLDVPSQPTLVDVPTANGVEHALIQPTKRGELFYLNRETGAPLAAVEERKVPVTGAAPGERVSPTQPFSVGLPSVAGPTLTERDMWGITPLDQLWCRLEFRKMRYDGTLTPPGLRRALVYPGYAGGNNWGGVTVDTDRHLLVAPAFRFANWVQLLTRQQADKMGLLPIVDSAQGNVSAAVPQAGTPYGAAVGPFMSPLKAPCQNPPYATISAIDLVSRKLVWTETLGTARNSGPFGLHSQLPLRMGVPLFGGAITTAGGLTFVGATQDGYFRAIDTMTGKVLWETKLPTGGHATPMSYLSSDSNRQFVVIAAAGNFFLGTKPGDYIVAYALPK